MYLAYESKIPSVSSMGAGARLEPTLLQVVDISKTYICPFVQQIRKTLRTQGVYRGIEVFFKCRLSFETNPGVNLNLEIFI